MRKLFWCCSAAGALVVGGMFSASYYASHHSESTMGRCITTAASASLALQPVTSIGTVVARVTHHVMYSGEAACKAGSAEDCIPCDPQPIIEEPKTDKVEAGVIQMQVHEGDPQPAPIVIHEDDPMPAVDEVGPPPSTTDRTGLQDQQLPDNICPLVMPYCTDDEEPMPKPRMPFADSDEKKQADGSDKSEDSVFKAWMKLFEEAGKEKPSIAPEELHAPAEDPQSPPKCQEDSHLQEHYPGCPRTSCPYTGKTYPSDPPTLKPGKEEISQEPVLKPNKHGEKRQPEEYKSKEDCPCTEGVDTMEYRQSDGGLNEYGSGPF